MSYERPLNTGRVRFGGFELDLARQELHREGQPVAIQHQPLRMLVLLVQEAGRVVSRDAIRDEIWGHSHLEVDQSINFGIRQIRAALGDDARRPRYIETVPRRGYRFIAPLEPVTVAPRRLTRRRSLWLAAGLAGVGVAGTLFVNTARSWSVRSVSGLAAAVDGVPTEAAQAYERATVYLSRGVDGADILAANALLETALAADSTFAAAHAQLAVILASRAWASRDPELLVRAQNHVARARRLDPDLPEVHHALGHLSFHAQDLPGAEAAFRTALALQPDQLESLLSLGHTQRRLGRWEEARSTFGRAYLLAPNSPRTAYALATTNQFLRRFDDQHRYLRQLAAIQPGHPLPRAAEAEWALAGDGDTATAWSLIRGAETEAEAAVVALSSNALTRVFARRILAELSDELEGAAESVPRELYLYRMGELHAYGGDPATAATYYDRARADLEARLEVEDLRTNQFHGEALALLAASYAGLGIPAKAEAFATEATRSIPLSVDEVAGVRTRQRVAEVLATLGHIERARDHVDYLTSRPSLLTSALLNVDPVWSALRTIDG